MSRTEFYRDLRRTKELGIALEALEREEAVVNHMAGKGYRVLATSDVATRSLLKMKQNQPAADIVAEITRQRVVIAEVRVAIWMMP